VLGSLPNKYTSNEYFLSCSLDPNEFNDLAENQDQSERLADFEKQLFAWLRQRKQRTVVHLDELYKRSPEADEKAGIIIGRW
jgi:hypothetical protein